MRARSIAIVGATPDDNKLGGKPVRFLRDYGFTGRVYPVNPKYENILGYPCYPDIEAIDADIDVAVVALPYHAVPQVIEACIRKDVRQAVVFSSGFAETGADGFERERHLKALLDGSRLRLIGPNTLGFANIADGLIANFSQGFELGPDIVKPGPVGFASQSGAFGTFIFTRAAEQGIGLNYYAVTGNELDVTVTDFLAAMLADDDVKIAVGYIEGIRDGRRFLAVAEQARRDAKPLVLIKTGRTPGGSAAALSHTAAIAGADAVYDAAFHQTGVLRVDDEEEMLDVLNVTRWHRKLAGRRIGVLTMSGGAGVLLADALEAHDLELAQFEPATTAALKSIVPVFGSVSNPVDLTGKFLSDPEILETSLQAILADNTTDAAIFFLGLGRRHGTTIAEIILKVAKRNTKPLIVAWTAGPEAEIRRLRDEGVAVLGSPTRSVRALAALAKFAEARSHPPRVFELPKPQAPLKAGTFSEAEAKSILSKSGVPMADERLCTTDSEAAIFATEIGFPVALKVSSPGLLHKTEAGAVALGIENKERLVAAFSMIMANAKAHNEGLEIEGVLVSPMAPEGMELIIGGRKDPVFGPIIMVGAGGIYTEIMDDAAVRVLPLVKGEAEQMLGELRIFPLLAGARGKAKSDMGSAVDCIEGIGRFLAAHPEVEELEINPLRVFPDGGGAVALDAVLRVGTETIAKEMTA